MFYYIEGNIVYSDPDTAVIDVSGVAYKMTVSYNTFASIAGKDRTRLYTYLSVSENGIELYGFSTTEELDVYKMLTSISGVGPKAAMSILSVLTPASLERAVSSDDAKAISKAQGIGNKTAQLIILKLKGKLDAYRSDDTVVDTSGENAHDALEALVALGYAKSDASKLISTMNVSAMSVEDIIREALKRMG